MFVPPLVPLLFVVCFAADDGLALLPPMGWRSWNAFHNGISSVVIQKQADGLADMSRSVDGAPASLASLGYVDLGIDEGWEACGQGWNNTQHSAYGWPVVDTTKFPDMNATTSYIHGKGLRAGWYFNGCACGEPIERLINYEGDVAENVATHFDSVKLDSCGAQRNLTLYYSLFNRTAPRPTLIENCHQGGNPPTPDGWCPYHIFRVSGDIINLFDRVMMNLQAMRQFLAFNAQLNSSLSRPGCWVRLQRQNAPRARKKKHFIPHPPIPSPPKQAYPDMLEVGRMPGETGFSGEVLATPAAESRAHFGAWVVSSAPLILGASLSLDDPSAQVALDSVWGIVTNKEAIAVSQTWAGDPGSVVREWSALNVPTLVSPPCVGGAAGANADAYTYGNYALAAGNDLHVAPMASLAAAEAFCSGAAPHCAGFTYHGPAGGPAGATTYFKTVVQVDNDPAWSTYTLNGPHAPNSTGWTLSADGSLRQGPAGVCVDAAGQLPQNEAPNWLRLRACNASAPGQVFHARAAGGSGAPQGAVQLVSNATGGCLGITNHWLWNWQALPALGNCNADDATTFFVFGVGGTLRNAAQGVCLASSDVSGPKSQVWRKRVGGGRHAVLVVNGALLPQDVIVGLAGDLNITNAVTVRDIWEKAERGRAEGSVNVTVAPHDAAFLLLTEAGT